MGRLLRAARSGSALRWAGALVAPLLASSSAHAEPFSAGGFVTREASGYVLDEALYDSFLVDVLGALRPRFGGTGRTTGAAGMDVSLGLGWTSIAAGSAPWQAAMDDAPDALVPLLFAVRKGLPGGLELGTHLAYSKPRSCTPSSSCVMGRPIAANHRTCGSASGGSMS